MKRLTTLSFAVAAVMAAAPLAAQGNSCTASSATTGCNTTVSTTVTVPTVMQLVLSSNTTDLGTPSAADYNAGHKDVLGPTATVSSNVAWKVMVTASNPFTGPYAKPASDVLWSAGTSLSATPNNLGTGAELFHGVASANQAQSIFYSTKWDYSKDAPGTYGLTVTFTLVGQ